MIHAAVIRAAVTRAEVTRAEVTCAEVILAPGIQVPSARGAITSRLALVLASDPHVSGLPRCGGSPAQHRARAW